MDAWLTRSVFATMAGRSEPIRVALTYRADDPYAVVMEFTYISDGAMVTVDWVCARDLLNDGLLKPTGAGDVRVAPHAMDDSLVVVAVSSPSGKANFHFAVADVADFLLDAYELVEPDMESHAIDWDREFARLAAS